VVSELILPERIVLLDEIGQKLWLRMIQDRLVGDWDEIPILIGFLSGTEKARRYCMRVIVTIVTTRTGLERRAISTSSTISTPSRTNLELANQHT
jgi:hypothetical protein